MVRISQEDILRLDIAVDDPALMNRHEGTQQWDDEVDGSGGRHALWQRPEVLAEAAPLQERLCNEERRVVGILSHVEHLDDVRVDDLRDQFGFLHEARNVLTPA
ncbi:MAG: hypothetical protein IPN17_24985 [Deltaproteobacteria bacterium]|nr:hypothetical protein [Deltaproteobacteria bacterium]